MSAREREHGELPSPDLSLLDRKVGDVTNNTAGLRAKGNLRGKRSDPWHRANAPPKVVADPELDGKDAESQSQTCLHLVRKPVAQPPAEAS